MLPRALPLRTSRHWMNFASLDLNLLVALDALLAEVSVAAVVGTGAAGRHD